MPNNMNSLFVELHVPRSNRKLHGARMRMEFFFQNETKTYLLNRKD